MSKLEYQLVRIAEYGGRGYPSNFDVSTVVNIHIKQGWEPLGSPVFVDDFRNGSGYYMVIQAMTRAKIEQPIARADGNVFMRLLAWLRKG